MNPEFFVSALVTLFVVVDPLGLVPIFTSLTARLPVPARRRVAIRASLIAVIAVVMAACLIAFLLGTRITKLLGVTGNVVLERLLGVILAALAVQFVIDGVRAVWS